MTSIPENTEEAVQDLLDAELESLSEDQKASLSKVLFPTTHTDEVSIGETKFILHPLTIKFSKQVSEATKEFTQSVSDGVNSDKVVSIDAPQLDALKNAARVIVGAYGKADLVQKIIDDDVSIEDLQDIVMKQQRIQGLNDFLLFGLRLLIKVMQMQECLLIKMETNLITST